MWSVSGHCFRKTGGPAVWWRVHTACVSECQVNNETFCDDYDRYNVLQWLCDSCKEQNKETTLSGMLITWGKMKDLKKIRKSLDSAYQKIVKWKKNYMQIPRRKAGKTLIAEVTRLIRLFNSSKRWESVRHTCFKYFCHEYSRSHLPNQKTKNMSNTWTKEWNGGNTER